VRQRSGSLVPRRYDPRRVKSTFETRTGATRAGEFPSSRKAPA
jgi:hypothetical protein